MGVVSAGFLIGALLFAALAVVGIGHDARLNSHGGVTTTATVTDCDGTEVVVDFTTQDGERVSGDYISWPNQVSPAVGDRVEITYDSTDPTYIVAAGSAEDRLLGIGFTGAAVVAGELRDGCRCRCAPRPSRPTQAGADVSRCGGGRVALPE